MESYKRFDKILQKKKMLIKILVKCNIYINKVLDCIFNVYRKEGRQNKTNLVFVNVT